MSLFTSNTVLILSLTLAHQGLSFTLRFYYDLIIPDEKRTPADDDITDIKQLEERIRYTPKDLEHESAAFVEKLRFLGDPFTFGRGQLGLFLKTMYDTMNGAVDEDEE